jgi:DNA-directed RNA polymerase subunit beta'
MRTVHSGGAASRTAVASSVEAKSNGVVHFAAIRSVTNARGESIAISRNGEIIIADDSGRERERHKVPYGATLTVEDGAKVKAGQPLASWDPLTRPIITSTPARRFENVEEGVTVANRSTIPGRASWS